MKKALIAAAAGLFLLAGLPVFAQTQTTQTYAKDAYYKSIPLRKIWMHPLGYVIQFFNSKSQISDIYVPLTWFNKGIESKADIIYGADRSYPYAVIFWVDGKFDHIKLYVLDNYESLTWGVLESVTDLTSRFNVDDVPKDF